MATWVLAHRDAVNFAEALDRAGAADTTDFPACGIHNFASAQRYLHAFWPQMTSTFGHPPPASFNYRRVDPAFTVWGWSFTADAKRAAEFLDIGDASRAGLTLTGSGIETVTTAPYFSPGKTVTLSGARERSDVANASGQITFTVDLGPPHPNQEYSLQASLAGDGRPGYMTTRHVTFASNQQRRSRHATTKHRKWGHGSA